LQVCSRGRPGFLFRAGMGADGSEGNPENRDAIQAASVFPAIVRAPSGKERAGGKSAVVRCLPAQETRRWSEEVRNCCLARQGFPCVVGNARNPSKIAVLKQKKTAAAETMD